MSRIGKKPIEIPSGVKVSREQAAIKAQGPKGNLSLNVPGDLDIAIENGAVLVSRPAKTERAAPCTV